MSDTGREKASLWFRLKRGRFLKKNLLEDDAYRIAQLEVEVMRLQAADRIEELESYTPSQWTQQLSKAREKWQKRAEELEKANETYGIELIARVEELGKLEVKLKLAEDGLEKIKSKRILDKIGMRVVAIATLEQLREE